MFASACSFKRFPCFNPDFFLFGDLQASRETSFKTLVLFPPQVISQDSFSAPPQLSLTPSPLLY